MTAVSAVIFLVSARYNMATAYIMGRVENGEYALAIAYAAALDDRDDHLRHADPTRRRAPQARTADRVTDTFLASGHQLCSEKTDPAKRLSSLSGVRKNGFGATVAVDGVSLTIARCETGYLSRPSGCGPKRRACVDCGPRIAQRRHGAHCRARCLEDPASARNVGMVFQSYALFPHIFVLDNVAYTPINPRHEESGSA